MNLERAIGIVLRTGVAISTACLALGLLVSVAGARPELANVMLHTGIIILLLTPVSRVVVSIVEYVIERDWMFATLTAIVFVELLASAVAALVFNRRL